MTVDEFIPSRTIRIDTSFWQHRSIFAGTQEQLSQLRAEADARAARRALVEYLYSGQASSPPPSIFATHRPAVRRLKAILHVGLFPMLWLVTTCRCGGRWPCNDVKQHYRAERGWTVDITDDLDRATRTLPKPVPRWRHLLRRLRRRARPILDPGP